MRTSPSRFQDFQRSTPPELKAFERLFMKGIDKPSLEQAQTLKTALYRQDRLADDWTNYAAQHLDRVQAQNWLDLAFSHGVDNLYAAPQPLVDLFQQIERVPLWLDHSLLNLARKTVRRSGPLGNWLLVNVALMGGYRYEGVIQPLLLTGRLTEYAPTRLADTTKFVQDVLSDDGLKPKGQGISATIRVRLLHAHIRFHLNQSPKWSKEKWGAAINQADLLATLLLFSLSFLVTCRVMGLRFTKKEAQSVIHLWRYVGYLIGIDEHLLPSTEDEARKMFYLVGKTQTLAGAEAALLGKALHEVPLLYSDGYLSELQAKLSMKVRSAVSDLFLGDEALKHLGIPKTRLKYLLMGSIPVIYAADTLRSRSSVINRIFTDLGGRWQDYYTSEILKRSQEKHSKS